MQLHDLPPFVLRYRNQQLDLSTPQIMGILNVTPDSFSDGGKYNRLDAALRHTEQMLNDGAAIIDIGGESTRPDAVPVSEEDELARVVPMVAGIRARFGEAVWLSVDTSSPVVMRAAAEAGASIWNDVRALTRPNAIQTAAQLAIPVILMHMRGEPTTMNQLAHYDDIANDVINELQQRIDAVLAGGVARQNIVLDPGFGFAKHAKDNLALLNAFARLHTFNLPVMVAISRKRVMGEVLSRTGLPSAVDARDVVSMVAAVLAVQQGACIVRAHDVATTKAGLAMWQAMIDEGKSWQ